MIRTIGLCFAAYGITTQQNLIHNSLKNDKTQSFIWGNGYYQPRPGQNSLSFSNFTPKLLTDFDGKISLTQLFLNEWFEAGITKDGEVYVWEAHKLSSYQVDTIDDGKRKNIQKLKTQDKAVQVQFTKGFAWVLTNKGEVYQYPIDKKFDEENKIVSAQLQNNPRKIKSLTNMTQIETGEDHFVGLSKDGKVFTMGDDTLGQCGQGPNKRSPSPPFYEQRIRNPQEVESLPKIRKVICGTNHTLAISQEGSVFGWGSNSQMQLSQLEDFSKVDQPLIAVYQPLRVSALMEAHNIVTDIAAGEETSFFVTQNKLNQETEVFGCGHNVRGQLGAGFLRHVSDIVKLEGLSNYKVKVNNEDELVRISQMKCGRNHCMALLSIGALLEWGDNEYGQLGNKKRSFNENPLIVSQFTKDKVVSINCGDNSSGVVIESREQEK